MAKRLSEIVSDWGGFEELVAKMQETGSVHVERNVVRAGRSGAPRQIDVLVTHTEGLFQHEIVIECKYWNKAVSRLHVDALATTVNELNASKGVIFTVEGFQEGAIQQAEASGINLYKVREPTDDEWGRPGRVIDFWLHINRVSPFDFRFPESFTFDGYGPKDPRLELHLGKEGRSHTPINITERPERTLEDLLEGYFQEAAKKVIKPWVFRDLSRNDRVSARAVTSIYVEPKKPIVTLHDGGVVVFPKIVFKLGVEVNQSRFFFDRAEKAHFVLAVEDCVAGTVYASSRYDDEPYATVAALSAEKPVADDVFENGSVVQVWTAGYADEGLFLDIEPRTPFRLFDYDES